MLRKSSDTGLNCVSPQLQNTAEPSSGSSGYIQMLITAPKSVAYVK